MDAVIAGSDTAERRRLSDALKTRGHTTREGGSAGEVVVAVVAGGPDIIVLGAGMTGTDGLILVRMLKDTANTRDIPIVAIVDPVNPSEREELLAAGCAACFFKAVDASGIAQQLEQIIRKAEAPE